MLSWVRRLVKNPLARVLIALLIAGFIFWGISNVLTLAGSNTAVAHIGGKPIDISRVQAGYQAHLDQARQSSSGQPDLETRQRLAGVALDDVLRQEALRLEQQNLGIAAPAAAIRSMVYAIPAFQQNNVFNQAQFLQVLQANNKTPAQFLADVRDNILGAQLILPLIAAETPPAELVSQIFSFVAEQRFAETVVVPRASQPTPAAPSDQVLWRYWRNHQADFAAPEIRQVKIVLLSPALLANKETVSDGDIAAAYARETAGQIAKPLRSVQVITTDDAKQAAALAKQWSTADWTKMQAAAASAGANPVELDKAQQSQFPSPQLGAAVFAAVPGAVTGPLQGPFGYFVFRVTAVGSSLPGKADVEARIKQQLQLQKAQADVARDVDNVQDALAGQTPLDKLPGNLGLIAVQGSLDSDGNTEDGTPAPIPGGAALKAAVVKAAFAAHPNDPPQLINGPDGGYFALSVDSITPASTHPYDQVKPQVAAAWTADQISREAESKAAILLAAVNHGQTLDQAAAAGGYAITMSPPVTRNAPAAGVSNELARILFTLKPGQATMQQSDTGFTIAVLAKIVQPQPAGDPSDYAQVQSAIGKSMQNDIAESFIAALQAKDHVSVDQKLFAQIYR